jgi:hypothetical protein
MDPNPYLRHREGVVRAWWGARCYGLGFSVFNAARLRYLLEVCFNVPPGT